MVSLIQMPNIVPIQPSPNPHPPFWWQVKRIRNIQSFSLKQAQTTHRQPIAMTLRQWAPGSITKIKTLFIQQGKLSTPTIHLADMVSDNSLESHLTADQNHFNNSETDMEQSLNDYRNCAIHFRHWKLQNDTSKDSQLWHLSDNVV